MTSSSTVASALISRANVLPLSLAGLFGLFIVGFVGFAHMDVVHNAGHDYRHSMAFPCH